MHSRNHDHIHIGGSGSPLKKSGLRCHRSASLLDVKTIGDHSLVAWASRKLDDTKRHRPLPRILPTNGLEPSPKCLRHRYSTPSGARVVPAVFKEQAQQSLRSRSFFTGVLGSGSKIGTQNGTGGLILTCSHLLVCQPRRPAGVSLGIQSEWENKGPTVLKWVESGGSDCQHGGSRIDECWPPFDSNQSCKIACVWFQMYDI